MRSRIRTFARSIRGALVALAMVAYLIPSLAGGLGASLCFAAEGGVRVGCCGPAAISDPSACCCETPTPAPRGCCAKHAKPATGHRDHDGDAGRSGSGRCLKIAPHSEPSSTLGERTPDLPDAESLGVVALLPVAEFLLPASCDFESRPDARAGPPPGSACPRGFVLRI